MADMMMCVDKFCPYKKRCAKSVESGTVPTPRYQSWGIFHKSGDSSKPENCDGWEPKEKKDFIEAGDIK